MRTWLWFNETAAAISSASSETNWKNVYIDTLRLILTWIGHTQPQGDPGGVFVRGSEHATAVQSASSIKNDEYFVMIRMWLFASLIEMTFRVEVELIS